jgi:hypothetical protein
MIPSRKLINWRVVGQTAFAIIRQMENQSLLDK